MSDIVERLLTRGAYDGPSVTDEAAAEITRLRADLAAAQEREQRMREALEWYGEQARLARLIHREGDAGRHALAHDGGNRARAALGEPQ